MAKAKKRDPKSEALAQDGVLNPNPEAVRDALFTGNPFFDAKDLVQVRYEMVRRHQVDGVAISEAAASVRRHPADLLQGPERAADRWARRSAAEPARPQGRPQDLCRGRCLRDRSQSRKPRADDLAMSRRDRGSASASRCTGAAWSGRWRAKKNESIQPDRRAGGRGGRSTRSCAPQSCQPNPPRVPASAFFAAKAWQHGCGHWVRNLMPRRLAAPPSPRPPANPISRPR